VALTTVGAPLGSYLAPLVTDRFERKWSLAAFGVVIALCGLLFGLTFAPVLIVVFGFLVTTFERGYTAPASGLGRLSNAAGPLIVAAVYQGSGYQRVFYFIAGAWLLGAIVLAVFGPRTRRARVAGQEVTPEAVGAS
jgi:putative MFS transporter